MEQSWMLVTNPVIQILLNNKLSSIQYEKQRLKQTKTTFKGKLHQD